MTAHESCGLVPSQVRRKGPTDIVGRAMIALVSREGLNREHGVGDTLPKPRLSLQL